MVLAMKRIFGLLLFLLVLFHAYGEQKKKPERSTSASSEVVHGLFYFYRHWVSPQNGSVCEFRPVCSEYARRSYLSYGIFRGTLMSTDRLMRDNPFVEPYEDPPYWANDPRISEK